ncbi:exonuclease domain-containing protein [Gordonia alkanivorans]|uniref:exonuclease domain-containing protein n=1 Tax=Gordonia alkanivorans TaxID=84096 RepID=UPI0004B50A6E|nr:exonuclease domain-containing protein [Gordonia alkanivorans]
MCIGRDQHGGPKRCAGDALSACRQTQQAATDAARTVVALAERDDAISREMEIVEAMQQALSGELTDDRESELLKRADQYRRDLLVTDIATEPEPDTRADWDRRVATLDANAAGERVYWDKVAADHALAQEFTTPSSDPAEMRERLRAEYESYCEALGEEPSETGLVRYVDNEMAATAASHEHSADLVAGHYLAQWRDEAIDCHRGRAAHMDLEEANAELLSRAACAELDDLITARDTARLELEAATEQWTQAKDHLATSIAADPYQRGAPAALADLDAARERINHASGEYLLAKQDLDHYQDCTAQYAARAGALYAQQLPTVTGDRLGAATYMGEFPQGSREWLEARQQGFGGSDIGTALGYDAYDNPSSVVTGKLRAITDEEAAQQQADIERGVGAAPRGHAWEQVSARRFAEDNPELRLAHTKATWQGREPWQQCHLDNVIVDDTGAPTAVWEGKTADDARNWADGIPVRYRAQLVHAMDTLGVDKAAITVTLDGRETRTYWMGRNEPIDPNDPEQRTYADRKPELRALWQKVETARRQAATTPSAPPKRNNGRFKWVANPHSQSSRDTNASTARQLAVYRGCSIAEAEQLIQTRIAAGDNADAAVRRCYDDYDPRRTPNRRFVVLDVETNGTHAGKHEILQTGYQVIDGHGNVHEENNSYHDINPRSAPTVGVGMREVHGIDYHRIHRQPRFSRSAQRERLRELAADPNVTFVAHSANFERSFLRANGIDASRVIDTMTLSRKFDHQSTGATLADFTAARGISYVGAHDAYNDARMTAQALLRFWDRPR